MKKFLCECALGLLPSKVWTGIADATGGYIIVREDGEVLCYHLFNRNEFENYLIENTRFETASTTRHNFGYIFKQNNKFYISLNLQIRFIKYPPPPPLPPPPLSPPFSVSNRAVSQSQTRCFKVSFQNREQKLRGALPDSRNTAVPEIGSRSGAVRCLIRGQRCGRRVADSEEDSSERRYGNFRPCRSAKAPPVPFPRSRAARPKLPFP